MKEGRNEDLLYGGIQMVKRTLKDFFLMESL